MPFGALAHKVRGWKEVIGLEGEILGGIALWERRAHNTMKVTSIDCTGYVFTALSTFRKHQNQFFFIDCFGLCWSVEEEAW